MFAVGNITLPLVVILSLCSCSTMMASRCATDQTAMANEMLFFGTDKPDGIVTPEDWQKFLNTEVTPRFPKGLSVWRASGQWRMENGAIVREGSYVLNVIHADDKASEDALNEIMRSYKTDFSQEAVLRIKNTACVSF